MKKKPIFDKRAFWSDDFSLLDPDLHGDYMIARVFDAGTYLDKTEAIRYYGLERIRKALIEAVDLQESTISFAAIWLNLTPTDFYAHNKRTANPIKHSSL